MMVVTLIPPHIRASHEAAGNAGQYPHNGAVRYLMEDEEAAELESLGRWVEVRDATTSDLSAYETRTLDSLYDSGLL